MEGVGKFLNREIRQPREREKMFSRENAQKNTKRKPDFFTTDFR
jgi:hypothetical protein